MQGFRQFGLNGGFSASRSIAINDFQYAVVESIGLKVDLYSHQTLGIILLLSLPPLIPTV